MGRKQEWQPDLRKADYRPYLTVNTPTRGKASRIRGWRTERLHHLLSSIELGTFYLLNWDPLVIDIREQYALPLDETVAIAERLGIAHPRDPKTKHFHRMTTDFVVTIEGDHGSEDVVLTCKPQSELESTRVLEKLEIERQYWSDRKHSWRIVTEADLPAALVKNLEWIYPYRDCSSVGIATGELEWFLEQLLARLRDSGFSVLAQVCSTADKETGLPSGTHLSLVRHALATRRWPVDMNVLIDPSKPIAFTTRFS